MYGFTELGRGFEGGHQVGERIELVIKVVRWRRCGRVYSVKSCSSS